MQKWLLIDGTNIAFRQFHAITDLKRSDGFPTNAICGWVRTLWKLEDIEKPHRIVAFFDAVRCAYRLELLPTYKGTRQAMPDDLKTQMPIIQEITNLMGHAVIASKELEADECLAATAARIKQSSQDAYVKIVSADKDFAQCVDTHTHLLVPPTKGAGWQTLDALGVLEKYGVPPTSIVDFLSLMGDTSDNIPGIEGVGPKIACDWLRQYNTLENILARADTISPVRFREKLQAGAHNLLNNKKIITLRLDLPCPIPPAVETNPQKLLPLLASLEMDAVTANATTRYAEKPPAQGELW